MNNKFLNKLNLFFLFSILLLAGATAQQSFAATWTVTKVADTNDNVCNFDCSLREAVAVAQDGDQIKFSPALAGGTITLSIGGIYIYNKDITIIGIDDLRISGGNKFRPFTVGSKANVTMKNLDIGYGYKDYTPEPWTGVGGAIGVFSASLVLEDCYIHNSKAVSAGGAIWAIDSLISIEGGLIAANQAANGGGGIAATYSQLSISNTRFNLNYTPNGGGAINLADSTLKMTGASIYRSSAQTGGAMRLVGDKGLYIIKDSGIYKNNAKSAGGIYNSGTLKIFNTTLSNNNANAGNGGALVNHNLAILRNVTVSANTATVDAGGIDAVAGDVNLGNTIVAGNTSGNQFSPNLKGLFTSAGHNLFGTSFVATITGTQTGNQFNADPMLNPLDYNGSATLNHLPQAGSPVIDAGSDSLAVDELLFPLQTDQRGFIRISGDAVDIGAVEVSN